MATDAPEAFFSYCREDSEFALRLAEDLKAAGASVWLDRLDIRPGQRWDRAVEDALTSCLRMLVILSPASIDSTNVMDEVSFALEEQKTVIPVHLDCNIPFRLRRVQYVDFRNDYDRGLKTLLKTLGVEQHALAASGAVVSALPESLRTGRKRKRSAENVIAHAFYETTGPNATFFKMYVRPVDRARDLFSLETSDGEVSEGSFSEVAQDFLLTDLKCRQEGYKRMNKGNSSGRRELDLP